MAETKGTDWMYNPNADMNKEEYLLGKAIGKNFESEGTMGQINAVEYDCAPPSIFASVATHQVDLQRKLIEDPLVAIKKRELDDRRRILDNPVKMKALQEHIEELKRKKKDKKKKKKKKKKAKDSDSDSDADLDLKLLKKIQRMEQGGTAESDDDFEEAGVKKSPELTKEGSESPVRNGKKQKEDHSAPSKIQRGLMKLAGISPQRIQRPGNSPKRRSPDSPPNRRQKSGGSPPRRQRPGYSPKRRSPDSPPRRKRSPDSPPRRKRSPDSPHRRKRSPDSPPRRPRFPDSPPRRQRSPMRRKPRSPSDSPPIRKERSPYKRKPSSPSTSPPPRRKSMSPTDSPPQRRSPSNSPPPRKKAGLDLGRNYRKKSPPTKRGKSPNKYKKGDNASADKKVGLSDAEKQAKLAEMMANATWRDQQRTIRVKQYRDGQQKEDIEASKDHDHNFMNRELKKAQESLTVEGRITANKYKIQRGHGDMDKNFAKR
eukprot:GFUD01033833.1.p1 GENE.GFUD01033833.1~~GFUD01033833.1.p1  ORF type:complete len:485 (+),score=167.19 GFUD01033833.1:54-1508(+)